MAAEAAQVLPSTTSSPDMPAQSSPCRHRLPADRQRPRRDRHQHRRADQSNSAAAGRPLQGCRYGGELLAVVAVREIVEHEAACPGRCTGWEHAQVACVDPPVDQRDPSGIYTSFHRSRVERKNAERSGTVKVGMPGCGVGPVQDAAHIRAGVDEHVERMQIEVQQPVARRRWSAARPRRHGRRTWERVWRWHGREGRVQAPARLTDRPRLLKARVVKPSGRRTGQPPHQHRGDGVEVYSVHHLRSGNRGGCSGAGGDLYV